jgi:MarR family transcriptional regulator, 2-MHQ and catechol-resistance regulon repressor
VRPAAEGAFYALLRTFGRLRQVMEPYFATHRISGSQWGILRALQRAGAEGQTALRVTELGQRLLIRPASVSGALDRLERQGLVERTASKEDRRVRRVCLTGAGDELVARVLKGHGEQIESLFTGLTSKELNDLTATLQRLERDWRNLAGRQPTARRRRAGRTGG